MGIWSFMSAFDCVAGVSRPRYWDGADAPDHGTVCWLPPAHARGGCARLIFIASADSNAPARLSQCGFMPVTTIDE